VCDWGLLNPRNGKIRLQADHRCDGPLCFFVQPQRRAPALATRSGSVLLALIYRLTRTGDDTFGNLCFATQSGSIKTVLQRPVSRARIALRAWRILNPNWLEQFDRVARRIFQQDLLRSNSNDDFVTKPGAGASESINRRR
jgi:hypothetical protein